MKPSDERVQKWHSEYHNFNMPWASDQIEFAKYIAALAYAAGRESMREEAAKVCDQQQAIDDRLTEGRYVPPSVCAEAIRNLPTSEGAND